MSNVILFSCLILFLGWCTNASSIGQPLPFTVDLIYDDNVSQTHIDSSGYLWFYDNTDVLRYDGKQIVRYGLEPNRQLSRVGNKGCSTCSDVIFIENQVLSTADDSLLLTDLVDGRQEKVWQVSAGQEIHFLHQDAKNLAYYSHLWQKQRKKKRDIKSF